MGSVNRRRLKHIEEERSFAQHAEALLIKLSHADTMGAALREWRCHGVVQDMGEARYRCQLRNTGPSQHLLTIQHQDDPTKTLLVNVTTILRYGIPVQDDDGEYVIEPSKVRHLLRSRLRETKAKAAMLAFREAVLETGSVCEMTSLMMLNVCSPIPPKTLRNLFHQFTTFGIEFDQRCFQIALESDDLWQSFVSMYPWQRWEVYGALTPQQQRYCDHNHLEPPDALACDRYGIKWAN